MLLTLRCPFSSWALIKWPAQGSDLRRQTRVSVRPGYNPSAEQCEREDLLVLGYPWKAEPDVPTQS